jgi:hypothetical protein
MVTMLLWKYTLHVRIWAASWSSLWTVTVARYLIEQVRQFTAVDSVSANKPQSSTRLDSLRTQSWQSFVMMGTSGNRISPDDVYCRAFPRIHAHGFTTLAYMKILSPSVLCTHMFKTSESTMRFQPLLDHVEAEYATISRRTVPRVRL